MELVGDLAAARDVDLLEAARLLDATLATTSIGVGSAGKQREWDRVQLQKLPPKHLAWRRWQQRLRQWRAALFSVSVF